VLSLGSTEMAGCRSYSMCYCWQEAKRAGAEDYSSTVPSNWRTKVFISEGTHRSYASFIEV
jgi:hypothetical protein